MELSGFFSHFLGTSGTLLAFLDIIGRLSHARQLFLHAIYLLGFYVCRMCVTLWVSKWCITYCTCNGVKRIVQSAARACSVSNTGRRRRNGILCSVREAAQNSSCKSLTFASVAG